MRGFRVRVSGARDMLADEKAKLSEKKSQLAQELEAARKHESISAAQHGAVAVALRNRARRSLRDAAPCTKIWRLFAVCENLKWPQLQWGSCALHEIQTLELELIQTQMAQKPMLRAEVGMRVRCANKASAE